MSAQFKFDFEGERRKAEGMESVLANTAEEYKRAFTAEVERLPKGLRFTVEDITARVGRPPQGTHYNAVGALVNRLAWRRLMRKTGRMVKARRPSLHATELAEWERL